MIDVCNPGVLRGLLQEHGFHFSKAKGQNFLIAPWVPAQIAEQSSVDAGTGVLEIGPGVGALTQQLCLRAGHVCAVEVDRRLAPILQQSVGAFSNLTIVWDDILRRDIPALVRQTLPGLRPVACANLPYYITTPVLAALLEAACFDSVTVMVQKEVARRIAGKPGTADWGAFSVLCQFYAEPEILFDVPPDCFMPRPGVTSSVVTLSVRARCPWEIADRALFFRTVRASFAMRRKTLQNGLAAGFPELGKAGAGEVIEKCGLPANVRGETLSVAGFAALSNCIAERISHV